MKKEMDFGVKFLHMLLDREGAEAVLNFARIVNRVVSEEEGLYDYDFNSSALAALKDARRRYFLKEFGLSMGTGWFTAGLGTTTVAGLHTLDDTLNGDPSPAPSSTPPAGPLFTERKSVRKFRLGSDSHIADAVELLIGGLLVAEGVKEWRSKREEQIDEISEAVSELCKLYPELKVQSPIDLQASSNGIAR